LRQVLGESGDFAGGNVEQAVLRSLHLLRQVLGERRMHRRYELGEYHERGDPHSCHHLHDARAADPVFQGEEARRGVFPEFTGNEPRHSFVRHESHAHKEAFVHAIYPYNDRSWYPFSDGSVIRFAHYGGTDPRAEQSLADLSKSLRTEKGSAPSYHVDSQQVMEYQQLHK
jgi:hypothetical protein